MRGHLFLGRYDPIRQLGEGGMGCVWLARDLQGPKSVVLKVMHAHIAAKPTFRERFQRETALMARLQHPNAVAFLSAAEDPIAGPFIVMEYAAGQPLDKILARHGQFVPTRPLRLLLQLCTVLQAAHSQKIVHCDLKPANLMILDFDSPSEKLKVMDFGLAQLSDQGEQAAEPGDGPAYAVGTPGYMPPEQVRGEPVDHRGDLYSVGVMLYRLLTGRLPFEGASTMEILLAQATGNPPTFVELGLKDAIAPGVEEVVRSCLEPDPAHRPQSARELGRIYREVAAASYSDMELSTTSAALAAALAAPPPEPPISNPTTLMERMEAWLPEAMAEFKLRGFAEAIGGEIVESAPGRVRIHLKKSTEKQGPAGLLSWLGLGRKPASTHALPELAIELHLRPKDPAQRGLLQVTILVHPAGRNRTPPPDFRDRAAAIGHALRSFLMCQA
ncbi:MAG TPA: serine/threonine-protein kinase [Gemmataceae bacterium]|nr:serine/threonine-protein kinase [Gemmataceae bacterium]